MIAYTFTAGEKEYSLRLTTQATVELEKKIGVNPLMIFGANGDKVPTVTTMVYVLWASLTDFNHGITIADTYRIFDEWLNDGHIVTDFVPIIIEIYKVSGLINNPKN